MPLDDIDNAFSVKSVAAGARHTLILEKSGKIYAMGDNSSD